MAGDTLDGNDEWRKARGGRSRVQDADGFANEEYFGLVDIDRNPRAACGRPQTAFGVANERRD